jgi:hypothetical protein
VDGFEHAVHLVPALLDIARNGPAAHQARPFAAGEFEVVFELVALAGVPVDIFQDIFIEVLRRVMERLNALPATQRIDWVHALQLIGLGDDERMGGAKRRPLPQLPHSIGRAPHRRDCRQLRPYHHPHQRL